METQIQPSQPAAQKRQSNLFHWANLFYAIIFAASILIAVRPAGSAGGGLAERLDPALLMILAQVGGILIPALVFLWLTRQPIIPSLKLRRLSLGACLKCLLIGILCWPVVILQGNLSAIFTTLVAPQAAPTTDVLTSGGNPWIAFLGLVLVAPLFEEILFRGVLMGVYEKRTGARAIWLVAILFALFHFSLDNLITPLLVGLIAGWLAYRTRSIWAGFLVHMGANLFAGALALSNLIAIPSGADSAAQSTAAMTPELMWTSVAIWGIAGLALLVPVFFLLRGIGKRYPAPEQADTGLRLETSWSTIVISLGAAIYFGTQLFSRIKQ